MKNFVIYTLISFGLLSLSDTIDAQCKSICFKIQSSQQGNVIPVERTFSYGKKDYMLRIFDGIEVAYGLSVSMDVVRQSEDFLVRILLEDNKGKNHLVAESYKEIAPAEESIQLVDFCEETALLEGIKPICMHIILNNAEVTLHSVKVLSECNRELSPHSEEFQKAGLTMKTVRLEESGTIKESMSFENIDYEEVYDNENWFDSRLYELFTSRFLFVVYRRDSTRNIIVNGKEEKRYILQKVFFWTMPINDIDIAEEYWMNIRKCVLENHIAPEYFWKIRDHRNFHVRPKGRVAEDRCSGFPEPLPVRLLQRSRKCHAAAPGIVHIFRQRVGRAHSTERLQIVFFRIGIGRQQSVQRPV